MRRFRHQPLPLPEGGDLLDASSSHHLLRVLRAAPGTVVQVFDGSGREQEARLEAVEEDRARLVAASPVREVDAPDRHLILAVLKGPAMELAIRLATEAGATTIHPFLARRSVATGDRRDRWDRIAEAACKQCGRPDLPHILPPAPLAEVLLRLDGVPLRVAAPGAAPLAAVDGPAGIVVGPEGGLTEAEVSAVLASGGQPTGLGRWILRAESAALAAVLQLG